MKHFSRYWLVVAVVFGLAGCNNMRTPSDIPLAVPLQPRFEEEVLLIRLEQILSTASLSDKERAELLFERGKLYDSLGLRVLARNDFSQAILLLPNIPEVFSYLGKYLVLEGSLDTAYEAFDSVLELEPTNIDARFERGVALYYGGRYSLAQNDLLEFYRQDPQNPFGVLWLYLIELKMDADVAETALAERYNAAVGHKDWGWMIVDFYLGKQTSQNLLTELRDEIKDNTSFAEHLSDTYFYLGKYYLSLGDINKASALFKLTVANNVHTSVGHRYALLELTLIGQRLNGLSGSEKKRD